MEVSQRYRWWVSVPPASADKERGGVASPGMAAFAKSRVNFPSFSLQPHKRKTCQSGQLDMSANCPNLPGNYCYSAF